MLSRMLKLTMVLSVPMAFFVAPIGVLSKQSFSDKICGNPITSERKLESGTACDSYNTKTGCQTASKPKYKVIEAAGCTVDHEGYTGTDEYGLSYHAYYYCEEGETVVMHGTVSCKYDESSGKCRTGSDWSVKNKKFKTCTIDIVTYGDGA